MFPSETQQLKNNRRLCRRPPTNAMKHVNAMQMENEYHRGPTGAGRPPVGFQLSQVPLAAGRHTENKTSCLCCAARSWLADKVQETQQFGPGSCDPALSSQCTQYRTDSDYEGRKHESSCSSSMKRRHSALLQRCKGEASARRPATQTRCVFATFCHLICQCDPGAAPQTAGSGESSRKSQ